MLIYLFYCENFCWRIKKILKIDRGGVRFLKQLTTNNQLIKRERLQIQEGRWRILLSGLHNSESPRVLKPVWLEISNIVV